MDSNGPVTDAVIQRIRHYESGIGANEDVSDLSDEEIERRIAAHSREREAYEKVRGAVKTLADTINAYSRDGLIKTAFIDEMCRTHRHLQGTLIVEILEALGDYGAMYKEDEARFADARNDFGMSLLAKLRLALKDELFWKDR